MTTKPPDPKMSLTETLSRKDCNISLAASSLRKQLSSSQSKSPKAAEDLLWSFWGDFLHIVSETAPYDQGYLVEFLLLLRDSEEEENDVHVWGEGRTLRNLPLMGPEMRSVWNRPDDTWEWVNHNAFAARITAVSSKEGGCMDYSLYCIWTLRSTLEDVSWKKELPPATVQAAAMWMIYASGDIHRRAVGGQDYEGRMGIAGKEFEGKEWRGHGNERWEAWREGFEKRREGVDDQTRGVIEEALEKMREAERG